SIKGRVKSGLLDRNLPPDFDDLIVGKAEEIADMGGIALHRDKKPLLPGRQALSVAAAHHRFMTHVISDISEIYRADERFAGHEKLGDVGTLHEAKSRFGAADVWHDLLVYAVLAGGAAGTGAF